MKNVSIATLFLFIFQFFLTSCEKELVIDDSNKVFPIELKIDTTLEPSRFSWAKVNNSNFKAYIIVRSADSIPVGMTPQKGSAEFKIVSYITDPDSTSFSDIYAPLFSAQHYKLYVDIGGRYIESPEVIDFLDVYLFQNSFNYISIDEDTTWVYLYDSQAGRSVIFDFSNNTVVAESSTMVIGGYITTGAVGGSRYLYMDNNIDLLKISLPSLEVEQSIASLKGCYSLISNGNGLLFSTNSTINNSFNIRKQSDLSLLNDKYRLDYNKKRKLVMLDYNSNRIAEIATDHIFVFNVNPIDGVIYNEDVIKFTNNFNTFSQIVSTKEGHYFFPYTNCIIYDADLNLIGQLNLSNSIDYAFSGDLKFIYVASKDANLSSWITKYSFPQLQFVRNFEIPLFSIYRIKTYKNYIVVMGGDIKTKKFIIKKVLIK